VSLSGTADSTTALPSYQKSQDRVRARYLLASDLIEQQQEKALRAMDGLEQNYSVLAPYIALKRAQAYDLNHKAKAQLAWEDLLKRYPDHPVAAEALFVLGSNQPKYWKQASNFLPIPHPGNRSLLVETKSQSATIAAAIGKHAYDQPGITQC